jgi:hypothetical protein
LQLNLMYETRIFNYIILTSKVELHDIIYVHTSLDKLFIKRINSFLKFISMNYENSKLLNINVLILQLLQIFQINQFI